MCNLLQKSDLEGSLSQFAINVNADMKKQFQDKIHKPFIEALLNHIKERLPDTGIFTAFSVFDPKRLPATAEKAALQKYGEIEVEVLNKQYGNSTAALIDSNALVGEWCGLRSYLSSSCRDMSMSNVLKLLTTNTTLQCSFPNFTNLASVCLCLPLTTTDCERAFSTMRRVKTRLRGQLINKTLNNCMRISIEGPPLQEFDFNTAVEDWSKLKKRRIFE